ncbi:sulfotransferase [Salinibacter ruber]|uniref:sulfotransferase n=1 Tax=Salinibacter ruber TaxID=146919 RepID=UPI0013C2AA92|nr:sulfotransferase [Salinibacter ruber]
MKPSFIIGGQGRAGTSSLFYYLKQHPMICMPNNKEINYFKTGFYEDKDINFYLKQFSTCQDTSAKVVGEASQSYMNDPNAAHSIHEFNPNMKFIFMLRDPAERAFSGYKRQIQSRGETRGFKQLIKDEEEKYGVCKQIRESMYCKDIKKFINLFGRDNLHLIFFDRYCDPKKRKEILSETCEFLSVDKKFNFDMSAQNKNESKMPLSITMQKFIAYTTDNWRVDDPFLVRLYKYIVRNGGNYLNHLYSFRETPTLQEDVREYLIDQYFLPDINCLEDLLDVDLTRWKT